MFDVRGGSLSEVGGRIREAENTAKADFGGQECPLAQTLRVCRRQWQIQQLNSIRNPETALIVRTPERDYWPASRRPRSAPNRHPPPAPPAPRYRARPIRGPGREG